METPPPRQEALCRISAPLSLSVEQEWGWLTGGGECVCVGGPISRYSSPRWLLVPS